MDILNLNYIMSMREMVKKELLMEVIKVLMNYILIKDLVDY